MSSEFSFGYGSVVSLIKTALSGAGSGSVPTGPAGGDLGGFYPNPTINLVGGMSAGDVAAQKTSHESAFNHNNFITSSDARLTNSRNPTGSASGDLTGSYPNPTVATLNSIAVATVIGQRAAHEAAYDHLDLPTSDQKDALSGTAGSASLSNKYVTNSDTRMTDSRSPSGAASGDLTGSYPSPSIATVGGSSASTVAGQRTAHEAAFNHTYLPSSDQKNALSGTGGTPSLTNRYATSADGRFNRRGFDYYYIPSEKTYNFSWSTPTLTISPKAPATSFRVFSIDGRIDTITSSLTSTVNLANRRTWVCYDHDTKVLSQSLTFPGMDHSLVGVIYSDGTSSFYAGYEMHTVGIDIEDHAYKHSRFGTVYNDGLTISTNALASGNPSNINQSQIVVADGSIRDEDILASIVSTATPTTIWEQNLGTVSSWSPALLPVYYRIGSGSLNWVAATPTVNPYTAGANNRIHYNSVNAGVWARTELATGQYGVMWILATTSVFNPIISVMGQATYSSTANARLATPEGMDWGDLPFSEAKLIARLIYQTQDNYATTPKAVLRETADYRTSTAVAGQSFTATVHNSLGGRSDIDTHPATSISFTAGSSSLTSSNVGAAVVEMAVKDGFYDYNDLATQTVPLNYVSGTLKITNDGSGSYSQYSYGPSGISSLFHRSNSQFDFTGLSLGDEIAIRSDIVVTTTVPNQAVITELVCGIGGVGTEFSINFGSRYYKSAGSYAVNDFNGLYIGNAGTKDNPAEFRFISDAAATIKVNGFYISVKRKK